MIIRSRGPPEPSLCRHRKIAARLDGVYQEERNEKSFQTTEIRQCAAVQPDIIQPGLGRDGSASGVGHVKKRRTAGSLGKEGEIQDACSTWHPRKQAGKKGDIACRNRLRPAGKIRFCIQCKNCLREGEGQRTKRRNNETEKIH